MKNDFNFVLKEIINVSEDEQKAFINNMNKVIVYDDNSNNFNSKPHYILGRLFNGDLLNQDELNVILHKISRKNIMIVKKRFKNDIMIDGIGFIKLKGIRYIIKFFVLNDNIIINQPRYIDKVEYKNYIIQNKSRGK